MIHIRSCSFNQYLADSVFSMRLGLCCTYYHLECCLTLLLWYTGTNNRMIGFMKIPSLKSGN